MTFSVAITHKPGVPERELSLEVLLARLFLQRNDPRVFVFDKLVPRIERGESVWNWSLLQETDFHLFLDDDVLPCKGFWAHAENAMHSKPDEVVSFFCTSQLQKKQAETHAWSVTADGVLGRAYCMSHQTLCQFLAWRQEAFDWVKLQSFDNGLGFPDDAQLSTFVMDTGRKIFHTLPSLVENDPAIKTTWMQGVDAFALSTSPMPDDFKREPSEWASEPADGGYVFSNYGWYPVTMCKTDRVRQRGSWERAYTYEQARRKFNRENGLR